MTPTYPRIIELTGDDGAHAANVVITQRDQARERRLTAPAGITCIPPHACLPGHDPSHARVA